MPSGKVKQKTSANAADSVTATVNEKILKECYELYKDEEKGLVNIAQGLGLELLAPRKKITILLLGNHSAGKSSFINWYVEEHIQKTGVAIETQGFSFITSGRKRESLTGNATIHLYPHFKQLQDFEGVVEYLTTEVSTSKQKKFSLVTFVDTPGLVDGDMKYPFDVDRTILWLGDRADLIFVFFDPIGQALCKRTLNLVEKMNEGHPDLIKFYLSKADTAGHESDRQRVLMQITQELCKRPGLNKAGFDMPTIFIPNLNDKPARCANQIDDVCKDVEKTINQMIQNTLNQLEKDCNVIGTSIDKELQEDSDNCSYNLRAHGKKVLFGFLGMLLPFVLLINFLASSRSRAELVESVFGKGWVENIRIYTGPMEKMWNSIPEEYHYHTLAAMIFLSLVLLIIARYCSRLKPTMSRKQRRQLDEKKTYVQTFVKSKKEKLYHEYLQQSIGSHEL